MLVESTASREKKRPDTAARSPMAYEHSTVHLIQSDDYGGLVDIRELRSGLRSRLASGVRAMRAMSELSRIEVAHRKLIINEYATAWRHVDKHWITSTMQLKARLTALYREARLLSSFEEYSASTDLLSTAVPPFYDAEADDNDSGAMLAAGASQQDASAAFRVSSSAASPGALERSKIGLDASYASSSSPPRRLPLDDSSPASATSSRKPDKSRSEFADMSDVKPISRSAKRKAPRERSDREHTDGAGADGTTTDDDAMKSLRDRMICIIVDTRAAKGGAAAERLIARLRLPLALETELMDFVGATTDGALQRRVDRSQRVYVTPAPRPIAASAAASMQTAAADTTRRVPSPANAITDLSSSSSSRRKIVAAARSFKTPSMMLAYDLRLLFIREIAARKDIVRRRDEEHSLMISSERGNMLKLRKKRSLTMTVAGRDDQQLNLATEITLGVLNTVFEPPAGPDESEEKPAEAPAPVAPVRETEPAWATRVAWQARSGRHRHTAPAKPLDAPKPSEPIRLVVEDGGTDRSEATKSPTAQNATNASAASVAPASLESTSGVGVNHEDANALPSGCAT